MALEGPPPPQQLKENISKPRLPKRALLASAVDGDRFVRKQEGILYTGTGCKFSTMQIVRDRD
ncbi:hypothetical protein N7471_013419 [Penicillium samsonianum]|uniref:uncharacterized protein n=1 Tax=Penicillium samsonianum TaxID=1882272 RepID=UPI002548FBEE|nr:uncharacterized protein N7471_013419 [Penicillium samsonianum]KAJ6118799.1 hypothetical protein N7471_013419 [Penicillium samsonianum]